MASTGEAQTASTSNQEGRGSWRGRGRGRPWRRGRGGKNYSRQNTNPDAGPSTEDRGTSKKPEKPRPTHFLALPLHTHAELSGRISQFHKALFATEDLSSLGSGNIYTSRGKPRISTLIEGLDSTILIDPIRMHMTLGVMTLETDDPPQTETVDQSSTGPEPEGITQEAATAPSGDQSTSTPSDTLEQPPPRRTIATTLELLKSLQPRIMEILDGEKAVHVPLDHLDVLKTERMRPKKGKDAQQPVAGDSVATGVATTDAPAEEVKEKVGAGVLFLGPSHDYHKDETGRKLKEICELVNKTFKEAGYLTDTRPLTVRLKTFDLYFHSNASFPTQLHCTILNASHRKPRRWQPFSYSDIVQHPACQSLFTTSPSIPEPSTYAIPPITRQNTAVPIQLGRYPVTSIQLWRMGSRGPNNEYVNCGGIELSQAE
ncbi:hypothetical protein CVT24_008160 [Panaeolus cyanescens]|uniref:A-kinase anchor protein 7-like phosphoesterase domain-containing protein n=1 Tax=Panaeolus cyanescens TaxID=181874 RepID=A0A409VFF2_9AGAR|nr:hypothetical protein CVT24_008160 [Panaeolus cyanescens]